MTKLDTALWRDMIDHLRKRHAPICRQWFDDLEPLGLEGGLLTIHTDNAIQKNYLQRQCREQFNEAAQATTGALVAVQFVTLPPGPGSPRSPGSPGSPGSPNLASENPTSAAPQTNLPGSSSTPTLSPFAQTQHAQSSASVKSGTRGTFESTPTHNITRSTVFDDELVLSPDYSFENFVTGPGNDLAYAAATAVSNQLGNAYNPLFIHGGVGLGKTHLLQAICQQVLHDTPTAQICYLSCESFVNRFLDCVQKGQMASFRDRYRHVDLLVIDDIQFLTNRDRSQEEFFHTFNALYQNTKQIVLSSDRAPSEIPQLEERLVSRFGWGLVTSVARPDYETRLAIVRAKAQVRGLDLPDDVICYIATRIDSNAREMEGAITTIQGHAALQHKPLDLALARKALGEQEPIAGKTQITLQVIIDAVTQYYNVRLSDLQSKRRHKSITEPRQICMWLARKHTRFSLEEIGGYFGGRDHTTVMHSIRTVESRMSLEQTYAQQVLAVESIFMQPTEN